MQVDAWQCQQCDHVAMRDEFEPVDPDDLLVDGDGELGLTEADYQDFAADPPYRCPACGGFNFGFEA